MNVNLKLIIVATISGIMSIIAMIVFVHEMYSFYIFKKEMCNLEKELKQEMKKYRKKGFNFNQRKEIKKGLLQGMDVSAYADPKFDKYQMKEIRLGLE